MKDQKYNQVVGLRVLWTLVILLNGIGYVVSQCVCQEPDICANVGICQPPPCSDGFLVKQLCTCCEVCLRMNDACDCGPDCSLSDCNDPETCPPGTVKYKNECDCCTRCWPVDD